MIRPYNPYISVLGEVGSFEDHPTEQAVQFGGDHCGPMGLSLRLFTGEIDSSHVAVVGPWRLNEK